MGASLGRSRHIHAFVIANGVACRVKSVQVQQSSTSTSDTFRATLAMNGLPPGRGVQFWSDTDVIRVVVQIMTGENANDVFWGSVDKVKCNWQHHTIEVSGRDESKKPIEKKSTESWKNKTSDEIVKEVAGRHGLTTDTDQTDLAGKLWNRDHVRITDQHSEWSLIHKMANREGKVAYAQDGKVYFRDLDSDDLGSIDVVYVPMTPASHAAGNYVTLDCERNLQLAKKSKVKVKSWHAKKKEKVEHEEELPGSSEDGENVYEYRYDGLTRPQAEKIAKKRLRENTRHERTITVNCPGNPNARPRMMANLTGTGTAFDQSYYIDRVTHEVGEQGYRMTLTSKNTSKKRGRGGKSK